MIPSPQGLAGAYALYKVPRTPSPRLADWAAGRPRGGAQEDERRGQKAEGGPREAYPGQGQPPATIGGPPAPRSAKRRLRAAPAQTELTVAGERFPAGGRVDVRLDSEDWSLPGTTTNLGEKGDFSGLEIKPRRRPRASEGLSPPTPPPRPRRARIRVKPVRATSGDSTLRGVAWQVLLNRAGDGSGCPTGEPPKRLPVFLAAVARGLVVGSVSALERESPHEPHGP